MTEQHNITISLDKEDFEALEATGYDIPMNVTRFLRDKAQTCKRKLAQQKKDDIKNIISACLGGGAWVFYGELMSGEYFMTDNYGDIIVLDESPKDFDKSLYNSWQEKHFIRWIEGDARNTFLRSMLDRITKNLPDDDDGGITERELEQIKHKMGVLTEEKMSKEYEEEEIIPTKAERKEWKEYLYNSLLFLATERPEFRPRKKDSLETLKDSFFYWADEFNEGYFSERDEASTDRYCAWLVQEFDRWAGYHYGG